MNDQTSAAWRLRQPRRRKGAKTHLLRRHAVKSVCPSTPGKSFVHLVNCNRMLQHPQYAPPTPLAAPLPRRHPNMHLPLSNEQHHIGTQQPKLLTGSENDSNGMGTSVSQGLEDCKMEVLLHVALGPTRCKTVPTSFQPQTDWACLASVQLLRDSICSTSAVRGSEDGLNRLAVFASGRNMELGLSFGIFS